MAKSLKKRVVVGGTFDILHAGHKALLEKAFSLGSVTIGLTSDRMASETRQRKVNAFLKRKKALEDFIRKGLKEEAVILKIEDKYGMTLERDFDYIIVSPATFKTALEINEKRKEVGRKPIKIVKIKFVLGKDGKPLSSTGLANQYEEIIKKLKSKANRKNIEGMVRFGISPKGTLGISVYFLRDMAKEIGKDHELAQRLWASGIHEARLLAGFVDVPEKVTDKQMEKWVKDFDSWDICDQVCSSLFDKTKSAYKKAIEWTKRKEEFIKRAGFVMMACLSVHDKSAKDKDFEKFFPIIKKHSIDQRNFVRKAVNWALRQIGKRNLFLNKKALKVARDIQKMDSKSAKWIATDAIRELEEKKKTKFNQRRNLRSNTCLS